MTIAHRLTSQNQGTTLEEDTTPGVMETCGIPMLLLRSGNFIVNEVLLRRDYC